MPIISVIIPIFNAELYLRKCIESVMSQSFSDYELLLINDGSTDNSGLICEEYKNIDSRIKVFHKKNGGVSSARNLGLNKATGLWVVFIDSDDWVECSYLKSFFNVPVSNTHLVLQGLLEDVDNEVFVFPEKKYESNQIYKLDSYNISKLNFFFNGYPFCKLYDIQIIREYKIEFNEKIDSHEDSIFYYDFISHIDSIGTVQQSCYHYVRRDNDSLSQRKHSFDKAKDIADNISWRIDYLFKKVECDLSYKYKVYSYVLNLLDDVFYSACFYELKLSSLSGRIEKLCDEYRNIFYEFDKRGGYHFIKKALIINHAFRALNIYLSLLSFAKFLKNGK